MPTDCDKRNQTLGRVAGVSGDMLIDQGHQQTLAFGIDGRLLKQDRVKGCDLSNSQAFIA